MESWLLVVIGAGVGVFLLLVGAFVLVSKRRSGSERSGMLRDSFGPEYDRTIENAGKNAGERELQTRQQRSALFEVRSLSPVEIAHFSETWKRVQAEFVGDPLAAVTHADQIVSEIALLRGYPSAEFEAEADALSVDYPRGVQSLREAHEVLLRNRKHEASTEELRTAMMRYQAVVNELLDGGAQMQPASGVFPGTKGEAQLNSDQLPT
ncbi:hypothetical protein AYO38_02920 [bacterium SCGC AG-212-C10]|nr:hypothetical protein AYO38_02920 [bacterium SCGC AG-212-C10]